MPLYRPDPDAKPDSRFPNLWSTVHRRAHQYRPDLRWAISCETRDGGAVLGVAHIYNDKLWGFAVMLNDDDVPYDAMPEWCDELAQRLIQRLHVELVRMN